LFEAKILAFCRVHDGTRLERLLKASSRKVEVNNDDDFSQLVDSPFFWQMSIIFSRIRVLLSYCGDSNIRLGCRRKENFGEVNSPFLIQYILVYMYADNLAEEQMMNA